jgi:hypothetical protein
MVQRCDQSQCPMMIHPNISDRNVRNGTGTYICLLPLISALSAIIKLLVEEKRGWRIDLGT